jgi:uncharacterized RDD family membrane protein YckC
VSDSSQGQPPGWYYAQGDPPDTQRYWDGTQWQGGPQPVPSAGQAGPGMAGNAGGAAGQLADAPKRILARFIDLIIWIVIFFILGIIFLGGSIAAAQAGDGVSYLASLLAGLIGAAIFTAYEVLLPMQTGGATLGKLVLKMKVVKEDGEAADMQTLLMRFAPYIGLAVISSFLPFIAPIPFLIMLLILLVSLVFLFTDEKRQAVWDKIGKTIVVDA